jgi:hypothetical protein
MKLKPQFFLEGEDGNGCSNGGGGTLLSRAAGDSGSSSPSPSSSPAPGSNDEGASTVWDFRSSLDDKGNFKPGWDAGLPDDLKPSAATLAKYPNPVELLRGHANASKLIGQKSTLKAPAPDAPAAEVEKFTQQIRELTGVPAKVEDYKIAKPDKLPDGLTWDEAQVGEFAKLAHSLNITPAAAQKLVEFDAQRMAQLNQTGKSQLQEFVKSQEAELRKDWGNDFEANMGLAAKAAQVVGFDLEDGELGNNAKFVKAMLTVSRLIKPDSLVGSDKAGIVMDGAAQAEDIRRNPNNPWHKAYMGDEGAARQQEAAALMRRLKGVKDA